jgi:hypothetical protein
MDTVIHNAGVYGDTGRHPSLEGHPRVLTVNALAPYLLTGLVEAPDRLIYLTSDMHIDGEDSLRDLTWSPGGGTAFRPIATANCSSPPSPSPSPVAGPASSVAPSTPAGCHPDGRPQRQRRPRAGPPHPDLARDQRRPGRPPQRRVSGTTTSQPRRPPQPAAPTSKTACSTSSPTSPGTSRSPHRHDVL